MKNTGQMKRPPSIKQPLHPYFYALKAGPQTNNMYFYLLVRLINNCVIHSNQSFPKRYRPPLAYRPNNSDSRDRSHHSRPDCPAWKPMRGFAIVISSSFCFPAPNYRKIGLLNQFDFRGKVIRRTDTKRNRPAISTGRPL